MSTKGVILIGGPSKGTRFRPLSLDKPKPLFELAGKAMIWHQISALAKVKGLNEVILLGVYEDRVLEQFLRESRREFPGVQINYLREFRALGTAGGLYHFRDAILRGKPDQIFILNADICSTFPLSEMQAFHGTHRGVGTIVGKQVPKGTEQRFGVMVVDGETKQAIHYVEKPESWVSSMINTGVYLFDKSIFDEIKVAMEEKSKIAAEDPTSDPDDIIHLEQDVITRLAANRKLYVYETKDYWSQIKTAGSALPANAHYLSTSPPSFLTPPTTKGNPHPNGPEIVGSVFIDPSAQIDPSAKIGPNVSIGKNVVVGKGVRVLESIVLEGSVLEKNSVVIYSIVGAGCKIGAWARVSGEPEDLAAVKPQKTVTILADHVTVAKEVCVRSCIVLPQKVLHKSSANEVLL
ncbi:nucleotide-diphospho-sugar transferase [Mrakia frigida]|uniref:mannose-1-phosphate guanylyltransferase n=1 Tax=Mrakia frigida TaxID=29902 RepID=UPI003FCC03E0